MPIFQLDDQDIRFPPPEFADASGLLAVGGDLSSERVLSSYYHGVFHWFNEDEQPILWWSPDPRLVLFPDQLKISKSMRPILRSGRFRVTYNHDFRSVILGCMKTFRPNQVGEGSWISDEVVEVYCDLHQKGYAHSVEVWEKHDLVGGLYGIILGKCFFGESMFTKVSNASKIGFITMVHNLKQHGCQIIDCQVSSNHLLSLGAQNISRESFLNIVNANFDVSHMDLASTFDTQVSW